MTAELKVQDGQVVSMEYVLRVDGEVFDASEEGDPLLFIQGEGQIVAGLESALYGMAIGESRSVLIVPEDGYGLVDPEAFVEVPREQFPSTIVVEPGIELQIRDEEGHTFPARIDSIGEETVRLDLNHPLAGKELEFAVKVIALRPATEDELAHGHVHDHNHDHS